MTTSYNPPVPARPVDFQFTGRHLRVVDPLADGRDDLLAELLGQVDAGVRVQLVAPVTYLDPCGTCPDLVFGERVPVADPVAAVQTTTARGRTYTTPVCAEHIGVEVTWAVRLGHRVTVLVPNGEQVPA